MGLFRPKGNDARPEHNDTSTDGVATTGSKADLEAALASGASATEGSAEGPGITNNANLPVGMMIARKGAITINQTTAEPLDPSRAKSAWRDGMGVAASRSAQILLVLTAVGLVVYGMMKLSTLIIPILIALIVACALRPMMSRMETWGIKPLWGTIITLLLGVAIIGGLVTMIVNSVRNQVPELVDSATEGIDQIQEWLTTLPFQITDEQIENVRETVVGFLTSSSFGSSAVAGLSATGTFVTSFVLFIVVLFFFLKDGPGLWSFVLRPFEGESYDRAIRIGKKTVSTLGAYVRGTATVAAVDGIGIGLGLMFVGVPLALPLGVITFLLSFIPLVGATIAGVFAALVALVAVGWVKALIVVGIVILVQQLEGNLLQPKIMGTTLQLHPLVILLALTAGTIVAGILGALLAVPIAAVAWGILIVWDGENTPAKFIRKKNRTAPVS